MINGKKDDDFNIRHQLPRGSCPQGSQSTLLISVLVARGGGTTPLPRSLIIVPTKTRPGCPTVAFASGSLAALVFSVAPSLMRTAPTSTWSPLLPIIRYYLFLLTTFVFVSFSVLSSSILQSANLSNLCIYAVTRVDVYNMSLLLFILN